MAADIAREIVAALPQSKCKISFERAYNHTQGVCVRRHMTGYHVGMYGGSRHNECIDMHTNDIFVGNASLAAHQIWALLVGMYFDQRGVDVVYVKDVVNPPRSAFRKMTTVLHNVPAEGFTDTYKCRFLSYAKELLDNLENVNFD